MAQQMRPVQDTQLHKHRYSPNHLHMEETAIASRLLEAIQPKATLPIPTTMFKEQTCVQPEVKYHLKFKSPQGLFMPSLDMSKRRRLMQTRVPQRITNRLQEV